MGILLSIVISLVIICHMFVAFNEELPIGRDIHYTGPIMFALVNVVLEVKSNLVGEGEGGDEKGSSLRRFVEVSFNKLEVNGTWVN